MYLAGWGNVWFYLKSVGLISMWAVSVSIINIIRYLFLIIKLLMIYFYFQYFVQMTLKTNFVLTMIFLLILTFSFCIIFHLFLIYVFQIFRRYLAFQGQSILPCFLSSVLPSLLLHSFHPSFEFRVIYLNSFAQPGVIEVIPSFVQSIFWVVAP